VQRRGAGVQLVRKVAAIPGATIRPLEVARARLDATRELDRFEREKADFFFATRNEYLRRAAEFPQRFRVIDSTRSIEDIQRELADIVGKLA